MKFGTTIAIGSLLTVSLGIQHAAAQGVQPQRPAPAVNGCQTCQTPPCAYAGQRPDCCCQICRQAPRNPLLPGRPTPPPCCVDGICYPNYATWGHYGTRWRPWPIQVAAATREATPSPEELGPDLRPYETLPPEEEDRRAPPPSAPRGEPVPTVPRPAAPGAGTPEAPPEEPPAPARPAAPMSPESIFDLPTGPAPSTDLPPLGVPGEETPSTVPLAPPGEENALPTIPFEGPAAPLGEPTGELDPPPAPPFATKPPLRLPSVRSAEQPAGPALPTPPRNMSPAAPQDDPPPAMPTLASVLRRR